MKIFRLIRPVLYVVVCHLAEIYEIFREMGGPSIVDFTLYTA